MHKMIWPALAGLLVCCATSHTPIASAGETVWRPEAPVTNYLYCTAIESARQLPDQTMTKGKTYYSGAFVTVGQNLPAVQNEFLAFLGEKYGFKGDPDWAGQISCTGTQNLGQAIAAKRARLDQALRDRVNVIETGWTFSGATATEKSKGSL